MRKIFTIIIATTLHIVTNAQDSTRHRINAAVTGSLNSVADGSIYMMNNGITYAYKHQKIMFNARTGFVFGQSLGKVTNRDYNAGSDFNIFWNNHRKWYSWGLVNALSSYSLNIDHQLQAGVGLAWNVFDTKDYYLNLSDGLVYEQSAIITDEGQPFDYSTIRNSLRVNFGFTCWSGKLSFKSNNFWQPSLTYKQDYIINSKSDLSLKLYKWVSLNMSLSYNRISRTGKENLIWTYGIAFNHQF